MSSKMRKAELIQMARNFRSRGRSVTDTAILDFLSALGSARALSVWLLYRSGEHDQLLALDINPDWYDNKYKFRTDYIATLFLSKAVFLKTSFDKKERALTKFLEFEEVCRKTNIRFRHPAVDPKETDSTAWLLNATKSKIQMILDEYSPDEFVDEANWGPGTTTLMNGSEVSDYNKFHDERGITRDLYTLVRPWFPVAYPSWWEWLTAGQTKLSASQDDPQSEGMSYDPESRMEAIRISSESDVNPFNFQIGNKIITVPKNSKTDRVIAVEPGINLWFQKAIGSMIRRRLSRFGVATNDQSVNQRLALEGSLSRELATVDFSSASDSISKELVRELIPHEWYLLLDACRSKVGTMSDGTVITWEKFSSMGNGFTFELETLIFYAAALAVREYNRSSGRVSAYGDDVILPARDFALFLEFSEYLGFRVNDQKSFHSTDCHFRESCGSHYFAGVDCKPIFLKERLSNVESFYRLANSVRSLARRYRLIGGCAGEFLDCWQRLVLWVPEPLRFRIPVGFGDIGFISNWDEARPARARYGIEGYYFRGLATVGLNRPGEAVPMLLARLRNRSIDRDRGNSYDLRGRVRRVLVNPLVRQWYDLGPWE